MLMVLSVPKHTDENGIKQGSNATCADKRVDVHSNAGYYSISNLYVMFKALIKECFKNIKSS